MMTDAVYDGLSLHLLAVAFRAGQELSWPREEAIEVIDWLARRGRAVEGIEVWLPASAGPEIPFPLMHVWQVSPARSEKESWADFVVRAKEQASSYVHNFRWDESDIACQGRKPFFNLDATARNMRIAWPAGCYRGFYGPSIGQVSIVSSHLARQATGRVIDATLAIAVDSLYNFCDLELSLAEHQRSASPLLPREPLRANGRVDTYIDEASEVSWFFDDTVGSLSVKVSSFPPEHWLVLAEGTLYLGIAHGDRLGAIVFRGIENDPEGELEGAWLEQIEQRH